MLLPASLKKLIEYISELPGIGPRHAIRLALYIVNSGQNSIHHFASLLHDLKKIKQCGRCFFIHANEDLLCDICKNPARKQTIIALIEKETDLLSLENTKKFNGRYCIIGTIPKTGILEEWQKLRLQSLKVFIQKECNGSAEEIIIAFNPTSHGDFNTSLIVKELSPFAKKITRLGRGLSIGGEIEFADDVTLGTSIEQRK